MANFAGGYILTKKGEALQAKAEAGEIVLNLAKFQLPCPLLSFFSKMVQSKERRKGETNDYFLWKQNLH